MGGENTIRADRIRQTFRQICVGVSVIVVQFNPPAGALPERSDPSMVRPVPVGPQTAAETPASPCWSRGMIDIECREAVALLTLNRVDKLNAIDRSFWSDLP